MEVSKIGGANASSVKAGSLVQFNFLGVKGAEVPLREVGDG